MKKVKLFGIALFLLVLASFKKETPPPAGDVNMITGQSKWILSPCVDPTVYVWFDSIGQFLDLNTVTDECSWTGFDTFNYSPFTVQEKGYQQCYCTNQGYGQWTCNWPGSWQYQLYTHP